MTPALVRSNIEALIARLARGYSKKPENHRAALALHFLYYNAVKIHSAHLAPEALPVGRGAIGELAGGVDIYTIVMHDKPPPRQQ